jgi:periplasmic glucans biosynthesis protein
MVLSRRSLLGGLIALVAMGRHLQADHAEPEKVPRGRGRPFAPNDVERLARALAGRPFREYQYVAPEWADLHYEQYKSVQFRTEAALWRGSISPFEAQLLLPGMLYRKPVPVFSVEDGHAYPLQFSINLFRADATLPNLDPDGAGGFSGVRLLSAPHRSDGMAEFAVFQGGSYFRALARGQEYGLSARGLALRTEDAGQEEFPYFRSFWLETPAKHADFVRLYALLDSPSATGAYTFAVQPGHYTVIDVEAVLFPRTVMDKVGIAPITSMFYFNRTKRQRSEDFRSGVHDSDGLLIANGAGEWLWRPLANPAHLQVSSFADSDPRGFGLMQRERRFDRFGDLVTAYHDRPSLWVQPRASWGEGAVFLVEIPTDTEVHDNIVAFWRPRKPWRPGSERRLVH